MHLAWLCDCSTVMRYCRCKAAHHVEILHSQGCGRDAGVHGQQRRRSRGMRALLRPPPPPPPWQLLSSAAPRQLCGAAPSLAPALSRLMERPPQVQRRGRCNARRAGNSCCRPRRLLQAPVSTRRRCRWVLCCTLFGSRKRPCTVAETPCCRRRLLDLQPRLRCSASKALFEPPSSHRPSSLQTSPSS